MLRLPGLWAYPAALSFWQKATAIASYGLRGAHCSAGGTGVAGSLDPSGQADPLRGPGPGVRLRGRPARYAPGHSGPGGGPHPCVVPHRALVLLIALPVVGPQGPGLAIKGVPSSGCIRICCRC